VRVAFVGGGGCVGDSVARRFDVIMLPDSGCGYGRCATVPVPFGRCAPQSSSQGRRRRQVYPQLETAQGIKHEGFASKEAGNVCQKKT
jgi:hypothetical protein